MNSIPPSLDFEAVLKELEHCYSTKVKGDHKEEFTNLHLTLLKACERFTDTPSNVQEQDVYTLLYMLGCTMSRSVHSFEALLLFQTALHLYENMLQQNRMLVLNTDEIIIMKIQFELAACLEKIERTDEAVDCYKTCLSQAMHCNDISFERKVTISLCKLLMKTRHESEAAVGFIRLVAIATDIRLELGSIKTELQQEGEYEEHEIHYQLCIALKNVHLYEAALQEALLLRENLINDDVVRCKFQVNLLLGDLHALLGNTEDSLVCYLLWQADLFQTGKPPTGIELLQAFDKIGHAFLKLGQPENAHRYFTEQRKKAERVGDPMMTFEAMLNEGDAALASRDISVARELFSAALKTSRSFTDDYAPECRCICKNAHCFAAEGRFTHALYQCEQALSLARKNGCEDLIEEMKLTVALYSQHSTSEKELCSALSFLIPEIARQEEEIEFLRSQDVHCVLTEEEKIVKCCKAAEVVLHRLGEKTWSLAFAEYSKRRHVIQARKRRPQVPVKAHESLEDVLNLDKVTYEFIDLVDPEMLLSPTSKSTSVVFTVCGSDILARTVIPGPKVSRSYLLSDHVISLEHTIGRVKSLITALDRNLPQGSQNAKCSRLYNIEKRSLPQALEKSQLLPSNPIPAAPAGDAPSVEEKGAASPTGDVIGNTGDKAMAGGDVSINPAVELYDILFRPLRLKDLDADSSLHIVPDQFLNQVPFDLLIANDGKTLGEKYNATVSPCLLFLDNCEKTLENKHDEKVFESLRNRELLRSLEHPNDLVALENVGIKKGLMGLVTSTATGTNVITSPRYIAPYKQIDFPLRSCVIGSPGMPSSLQYEKGLWHPNSPLYAAERQCRKVAEYLDVTPLVSHEATKEKFLKELSKSTVMHLCTYGDIDKGLLAFAPNSFPAEQQPFSMSSYIVTLDDMLQVDNICVKLLVLSAGHGWRTCAATQLPQVLLTAGVSCVVYAKWPVPDCVQEKFCCHLYANLRKACQVSHAVYLAKMSTKERYSDYLHWAAFTVIGHDVTIDLSEVRAAQLHQRLSVNEAERFDPPLPVDEDSCCGLLTVAERLPRQGDQFTEGNTFRVVSPELRYKELQSGVSRLSGCVARDRDVVSFLLGLVEEAIERLTCDENSDRPIVLLPQLVADTPGAKDLLHLMGFDLQTIDASCLSATAAASCGNMAKMVVFPHWNQDGLLLPVHQALIGVHEMCPNVDCLHSVALMLPLKEEQLCYLIDLLAVVYHTPEVQLRTSDVSVCRLWRSRDIRRFLRSTGVDSVRDLLVFRKTLTNRALLLASLQLLTSVALNRDRNIVEQLNVSTLGKVPEQEEQKSPKKLTSLKIVSLPRNEVANTSSWYGDDSFTREIADRKKVAEELHKLSDKYTHALHHAKWWHADVRVPKQSTNSRFSLRTAETASAEPRPQRKVKVQTGATPSCSRVVIEGEMEPQAASLFETLDRRQEARNILHRRCTDLSRRHAASVRASYLQFAG